MDTPSRFATVDLACSCGASLKQVDFAHRTSEAEGEFRAQHVTAFCRVFPVKAAGAPADYCPSCDKGGCFAEEGSDPPRHHRCRTVLLNPSRTKKGED